jgi:hypothetical protein
MKGTTKSGFKFNIDERIVDDWRLIDAIAMAESDDPGEQIKGSRAVADLLLGKEKESLIKFLQDKNDGFVPALAMTSTIAEIMTAIREVKNSQSSAG